MLTDHPATTIDDCRIINLNRNHHQMGTLTVAENSDALPFAIRRVFYIYDIPAGAERGGHSHHMEEQLIIAACGCFDIVISDGRNQRTLTMRKPYEGLYIPAGIWRSLHNFSSGSVCLTLCSTKFDESDYVRHFDDFLKLKQVLPR